MTATYKFGCPRCRRPVEVTADVLGQTILCPGCRTGIALPDVAAAAGPEPAHDECPLCGGDIDPEAGRCMHCGEPAKIPRRTAKPDAAGAAAAEGQEKTEFESHPSMFRTRPLAFVLTLVLCLAGVGLVILLVWWLRTLGTTLTVTDRRTLLRKGLLSRYITEVYHQDVRSIQVSQGVLQRLFGVGTVGISSAGQSGIEIEAAGIPHPERVKAIIDAYRARHA